jgi:hypothetical protein
VFEHVTVLLSFVYAIALTHLLSSATELAIARKRVRFSGLYAAWLLTVVSMVLVNWVSLWGLTALRRWTIAEVVIQFATTVFQYFTCSTFRITEPRDGVAIDVPAIYDERRPVIFSAFLALCAISAFQNWWDRNNMLGFGPNDWIGEDLTILPMAVALLVAGWARTKWLQWIAVAVMGSLLVFWLVTYTLADG